MHIALFGGTFDPPHKAHYLIGAHLIAEHIVDEVWFVPVKQHPFGKQMSSDTDRLRMLELMLRDEHGAERPQMRIEQFELEHPGTSYSYLTLQSLSKQYPEHQFSWVIGSDNLASFHKWGNYQELLRDFTVYVYPRKGFAFEPLHAGMIALEKMPEIEIASTDVRERTQNHQDILTLVEPSIAAYIQTQHLYAK